jgi:hypothetical protein
MTVPSDGGRRKKACNLEGTWYEYQVNELRNTFLFCPVKECKLTMGMFIVCLTLACVISGIASLNTHDNHIPTVLSLSYIQGNLKFGGHLDQSWSRMGEDSLMSYSRLSSHAMVLSRHHALLGNSFFFLQYQNLNSGPTGSA